MDVLTLSRLQFTLTISFHYIYPPLSIGLGVMLVIIEKRWLLWLLVFSALGPQIANQAGWFAAEVGRQPWIVQGLLRTSAGLSEVVKANTVLAAIILFSAVYVLDALAPAGAVAADPN